MTNLGPPSRGDDPLRVFVMAGALVMAAIAGAGAGFLMDFLASDGSGGNTHETAPDAAAQGGGAPRAGTQGAGS